MGIEEKITPDSVLVLRDLLSGEQGSYEDYVYIENLVKVHLFSRYPQRRKFAKRKLHGFFNHWTEVYTLKSQGIIYAYLSITKARKVFFLIGRYREEDPTLELVPDEEEIEAWATR